MKQTPMKLGPLALLLTVISICLTVLAILSFATAGADLRLAERHAKTVQTRYALEQRGQAYLQQLDRNGLPQDAAPDENGVIWTRIEENGTQLRIGVLPAGQRWQVVSWTVETDWTQDDRIGNLWPGG